MRTHTHPTHMQTRTCMGTYTNSHTQRNEVSALFRALNPMSPARRLVVRGDHERFRLSRRNFSLEKF